MRGLTRAALVLATGATVAASGVMVSGVTGAPDANAVPNVNTLKLYKSTKWAPPVRGVRGAQSKSGSSIGLNVDYNRWDSRMGLWGDVNVDTSFRPPQSLYPKLCLDFRIEINGTTSDATGAVHLAAPGGGQVPGSGVTGL
jgi:hypothetical protein